MRRILLSLAGLAGVSLGSRAFVRWLESQPERYPEAQLRQEPFGTVHFIERPDGTRIRAIVAGQGPTVVLAHGFAVSLLEWNIVWDRLLSAGFRVICFDQRGHEQSTIGSDGISTQSMSGDYLAVLEHFAVSDGILVGHSMGGFLALAAVLEQPGVAERLRGLVLFATFAGRVNEGAPQNRLQIPLMEHGVLQALVANRTLGLLFGRSMCGDHPTLGEVQLFVELFRRQAHQKLLPILRAFSREDRYGQLGQVKVPTVVICGRKDRTTPPWHSERMAREIPNARLVWVEGAGHALNWEAPDALVQVIKELAPK